MEAGVCVVEKAWLYRVPSEVSSYLVTNLPEDRWYEITVWAETRDGRNGTVSPPVFAKAEHNSTSFTTLFPETLTHLTLYLRTLICYDWQMDSSAPVNHDHL